MGGEIKQNHPYSGEGDKDTLAGRIQEFDFFLTRDGEATGKSLPKAEGEKRPEAGDGKKERNKSSAFFLPE